jgi:hypothetical protein
MQIGNEEPEAAKNGRSFQVNLGQRRRAAASHKIEQNNDF